MPTSVLDALTLGYNRLRSSGVAQVLATIGGVEYQAVASPDRDGRRTLLLALADFNAAGVGEGTQIVIDGITYQAAIRQMRDAGFYPTSDLTSHSKFPHVTLQLIQIQ